MVKASLDRKCRKALFALGLPILLLVNIFSANANTTNGDFCADKTRENKGEKFKMLRMFAEELEVEVNGTRPIA